MLPLNTGRTCVSCGNPTYFYDTVQKKCVACPVGMFTQYDNNTCACPAKQIFTGGKCSCPSQTPFYTANRTCIACYLPRYFNHTSLQCESCSLGSKFNVSTKSCQPYQCKGDQKYDNVKQQCICADPQKPYLLSDDSCSFCPEGKYQEGTKCLECTAGRSYFLELKRCACN